MKKLCFILLVTAFFGGTVLAQTVNVTFRVNTTSVPDTITENGLVQIRGTLITPAGRTADDARVDTLGTDPFYLLTWDGRSTVYLENVGGDYWEGTFPMPVGAQMSYKLFASASHDTVFGGADWEHQGWESTITKPGDYVYGDDRGLDLSAFAGTDTTLPVQFVNGQLFMAEQYFRPYIETDSIDIWFRVNMQTYEALSPVTQVVGVRGGLNGGDIGDLKQNETFVLAQEINHTNTGSANYNGANFWSGRIRIPDDVQAGDMLDYKFVIMDLADALDADPVKTEQVDRTAVLSADQPDTTLHWVWFEDVAPPPVEHNDAARITFLVDMAQAIQNRGFEYGDTVEVRVGYFSTAREVVTVQLNRQSVTSFYKGSARIETTYGMLVDYQYYSYKMGRDYREVYYNFNYEGESTGEAERRQILIPEAIVAVEDTLKSQVESRRMPFFRNVSVVKQDVSVTFVCDLRPAYYQVLAGSTLEDIQGSLNITTPDEIITLGLAMNGPATGTWSNDIGPDWGSHLMTLENKRMYDDGTHGDAAANDTIYAIQFQYFADSLDVVGQEFKFGIGGGDNEGGYGNNHIANIDDDQAETTIYAQFGSIDPIFYSAWNYDTQTGIEDNVIRSPYTFDLQQNYPNPFNPVTTIEYSLANTQTVRLTVYNIMGRQVVTLVDEEKPAGKYLVKWNGRNQNGTLSGSGLYFIKIDAGDFVKTHKMMFLK